MKTNILDIGGKKIKDIELPSCFNEEIRHDIIKKAFEAETSLLRQPYASFYLAGMQQSASGRIKHARRKYKTAYGYAISRVPRKVLSRRGGRFNWVGAFAPYARKGREAHPPKSFKIWAKNINEKEKIKAIRGAIAATANIQELLRRYSTLREKEELRNTMLPIIVESKIEGIIKTGELKHALMKILGPLAEIAFREKKIRAGKGKARGRLHKIARGLLIVSEKGIPAVKGLGGYGIDNVIAKSLNVRQFAPGGISGRLTIYTENAINAIKNIERLK